MQNREPSPTQSKLIYTWPEFFLDIEKIISYIKIKGWQIKFIHGLPRGGLIPAVILANYLNAELILDRKAMWQPYCNILIIDDISDSGHTLTQIPCITYYPTITLFAKTNTQFLPNYHLHTAKPSEWVIMPWESQKVASLNTDIWQESILEKQPDNTVETTIK